MRAQSQEHHIIDLLGVSGVERGWTSFLDNDADRCSSSSSSSSSSYIIIIVKEGAGRERDRDRQTDRERQRDRQRDRTLFYKDCSVYLQSKLA